MIQGINTLLPSSMTYFSRVLWLQFLHTKELSFVYLYIQQEQTGAVLSASNTVVNKTEVLSVFMGDLMLNITHTISQDVVNAIQNFYRGDSINDKYLGILQVICLFTYLYILMELPNFQR